MLYELLTDSDKRFMNQYIDAYAFEDCSLSKKRAPLDFLMRYWDNNKSEYLYRLLGNSFFAQKEVDVMKSVDELADIIELKCVGWDRPGEKFKITYQNYITDHYFHRWANCYNYCWDNADEWDRDGDNFVYCCLERLMDVRTLGSNVYTGPSATVVIEGQEKPFKLNKGCKASKAIGQLVKLFGLDKEQYEKFRLSHSLCLNEKNIKGTLTLSIHPIDYMTMSDNENGWQSCMNWMDGGEYRRGTVEMMNSSCVIVAYMASAEEELSPWGRCDVSWNSKKWRELFVVTPQGIMGIKGYPFWNRELEKETIMFLRQLAQDNLGWGPYNCEPVKFRNGEDFHVNEFNKDYCFNLRTDAMYNDFYGDHYCIVTYNTAPDNRINYSGESECMCCGYAHGYDEYESESSLACSECDETIRCYNCGCHDHPSNMVIIDGEYYCEDCAYDVARTCNICGEEHHQDYFREVYAADNEHGVYNTWYTSICEDCFNQMCDDGYIKEFTKPQANHWWPQTYFYVNLDDENIPSDLLEQFCYDGRGKILEERKEWYSDSVIPWSDGRTISPETEVMET